MNLSEAYEHLTREVAGKILLPGEPEYEESRLIWNTRLSSHPALIIRCVGVADVAACVRYFASEEIEFSVKAGGHSFAGNSMSEGNPVIDLSLLKRIDLDLEGDRARVQPGVKWGEVYQRCIVHERTITGGTVSGVGVSGYTLGGGTGYLARPFGLAIDNLLSLEVVTAEGEIIRADEAEHPDLFWALRGGSGNFGIVTEFEYKLQAVPQYVYAGQVMYPHEDFSKALGIYREVMREAPDGFTCYACAMRVPPIPAFPANQHGRTALCFVFAHIGNQMIGERVSRPLRAIGQAILDTSGSHGYIDVQKAFDSGCPAGQRWYSKSSYLNGLTDAAIGAFTDQVREIPGEYSLAYLEPLGGAISNASPQATAFPHRDASYSFNILAGWSDPDDDSMVMDWADAFKQAMLPHSADGVYVNLLSENESHRIPAAYASNFARLRQLKREWDPGNVFSKTYNIKPAD